MVGGSGRSRLRSALVLVQVSLSFVLLAGTGLLLQSLQRMQNTSPGFLTNNVIVSVVDLFSAGYKLDRAKIFHTQLLDRVRALPGVESAALTRVMPFSYNPPSSAPIEIDGYQPAPDEQPNADYVQVSENYFSTLGIPLVAGREFTRNDDENSPRVAIINETMAGKYWPGKDPIGQRLKVKDTWMQIVGVAKNVYYETKLEAPRSFFYVPVRQNFFVGNTLLIRTRETPAAITNALSREVHALDPTLAPYVADRLQEQVDQRGYTSATRGHVARDFRRDGVVPSHDRALCRDVVLSFATHARTGIAHGSRRRCGQSLALGDFARPATDNGRNPCRDNRRVRAHAFDGQPALQSQSARPACVRIGIRSDHARLLSRVFFARLARDTHRSSSGST